MSNLPVSTKPLSRVAALALTSQIRKAVDRTWELLLAAYEGQAHLALGYGRWEDYVAAEFNMTRGNAYRLVNQGVVTKALQEATGIIDDVVSRARNTIQVSAREAAVLKPALPEATAEIAAAVKAGAEPAAAVRAAVEKRTPPKPRRAPEPDPEAAAIEAEEAERRSRIITVDAVPLVERGDVKYLVDAIEEMDPRAAARLLTEREVMIIKRWLGSVVAARQEMAPLTSALKAQQEARHVEPRFKTGAKP
jgi:hypothetical protein